MIANLPSSCSKPSGLTRDGKGKKIDSDADFVAPAEELRRLLSDNSPPAEQSQTFGPAAPLPAAAASIPVESVCVMCMSSLRSVVLIPCGHLAVCQSCYSRVYQCQSAAR